MELERYGKFTLLIDGIYKCIGKIKISETQELDIKSVHIFWIYALWKCPEGMTATELASFREVDRSLISREISRLRSYGYIEYVGGVQKRRNYNSRLVLTEKGKELAQYIHGVATTVQNRASEGIPEQELEIFYSVLEKLHANFINMVKEQEQLLTENEDK